MFSSSWNEVRAGAMDSHIQDVEKNKRKSVVTTNEMMEMVDAAMEVMRMEDANELEKKVRKLHQGIALKKSGNLVFYTDESQLYTAG
ncbi:hypothetical protein L6452_38688 [Arctium lappa]|uniref:Uncharacterized protein n=1 Tax=Arctium lappa TaxID=4217 RepID=A0ACB8XRD6_ARCLA|nr:hypothetical protein L6452_38688 [Arctium lappa]